MDLHYFRGNGPGKIRIDLQRNRDWDFSSSSASLPFSRWPFRRKVISVVWSNKIRRGKYITAIPAKSFENSRFSFDSEYDWFGWHLRSVQISRCTWAMNYAHIPEQSNRTPATHSAPNRKNSRIKFACRTDIHYTSLVFRRCPQRESFWIDAWSVHRIECSRQRQTLLRMIYINSEKWAIAWIQIILNTKTWIFTSTKPHSIASSLYCLASFGLLAIGNSASNTQQNWCSILRWVRWMIVRNAFCTAIAPLAMHSVQGVIYLSKRRYSSIKSTFKGKISDSSKNLKKKLNEPAASRVHHRFVEVTIFATPVLCSVRQHQQTQRQIWPRLPAMHAPSYPPKFERKFISFLEYQRRIQTIKLSSNKIEQCASKRMRSPFAKVNNLLSSMTVFIFSIHTGSMSPSKQMYRCSCKCDYYFARLAVKWNYEYA